jgi:HTH-type transcriptional regulator, sugar sensing transcriptional regulator
MKIEIKNLLSQIGLNEVEIKVFLANLETGSATAAKIADRAGLNRVTTYEALKRLSKKALVKIRAKKNTSVRYFEAEDIEIIQSQLENKKEMVEEQIAQIKEMKNDFRSLYSFSSKKPEVVFYEGKEGIKNAILDTLRTEPKEILSFASAEYFSLAFDEKFLSTYWKKRTEQGIQTRGIMPNTEKAVGIFTPERNQKELRRVKFISQDIYNFKNEIDIYGNNVSIISLEKGNEHAIIIRSKSIADGLRAVYETMWNLN